jgi:hypothetical protein
VQDSPVALALSIDLFGEVGAVHSGADDNCVEGKAPVIGRFVVGITDVAARYVEGKGGFLYFETYSVLPEDCESCGSGSGRLTGESGDRILSLPAPIDRQEVTKKTVAIIYELKFL